MVLIHPSIISSVATRLGRKWEDEEGRTMYEKGEDCLGSLRDLQRLMRRDHPVSRDVLVQLGRWDIVRTDLVPIICRYRRDSSLLLNAAPPPHSPTFPTSPPPHPFPSASPTSPPHHPSVKLLVFLTMPSPPPPPDLDAAGRQQQQKLRLEHHNCQRRFKSALLHGTGAVTSGLIPRNGGAGAGGGGGGGSGYVGSGESDAIAIVLQLLVDPLTNIQSGRGSSDDWRLVQMIVTLVRNLLAIPDPPPDVSSASAWAHLCFLQDDLIRSLFRSGFPDILLFLVACLDAPETAPALRHDNLLFLEILNLLFRELPPKDAAVAAFRAVGEADAEADAREDREAAERLAEARRREKERAARKALAQKITQRHSRFGGLYVVRNASLAHLSPRLSTTPSSAKASREQSVARQSPRLCTTPSSAKSNGDSNPGLTPNLLCSHTYAHALAPSSQDKSRTVSSTPFSPPVHHAIFSQVRRGPVRRVMGGTGMGGMGMGMGMGIGGIGMGGTGIGMGLDAGLNGDGGGGNGGDARKPDADVDAALGLVGGARANRRSSRWTARRLGVFADRLLASGCYNVRMKTVRHDVAAWRCSWRRAHGDVLMETVRRDVAAWRAGLEASDTLAFFLVASFFTAFQREMHGLRGWGGVAGGKEGVAGGKAGGAGEEAGAKDTEAGERGGGEGGGGGGGEEPGEGKEKQEEGERAGTEEASGRVEQRGVCGCGPIAATMDDDMFTLVSARWAEYAARANHERAALVAAGSLLKEMIHMLDAIIKSGENPTPTATGSAEPLHEVRPEVRWEVRREVRLARAMLLRLFYDDSSDGVVHVLQRVLKGFNPHTQPRCLLVDAVETTHVCLRLLEDLVRTEGALKVVRKSRQRKDKVGKAKEAKGKGKSVDVGAEGEQEGEQGNEQEKAQEGNQEGENAAAADADGAAGADGGSNAAAANVGGGVGDAAGDAAGGCDNNAAPDAAEKRGEGRQLGEKEGQEGGTEQREGNGGSSADAAAAAAGGGGTGTAIAAAAAGAAAAAADPGAEDDEDEEAAADGEGPEDSDPGSDLASDAGSDIGSDAEPGDGIEEAEAEEEGRGDLSGDFLGLNPYTLHPDKSPIFLPPSALSPHPPSLQVSTLHTFYKLLTNPDLRSSPLHAPLFLGLNPTHLLQAPNKPRPPLLPSARTPVSRSQPYTPFTSFSPTQTSAPPPCTRPSSPSSPPLMVLAADVALGELRSGGWVGGRAGGGHGEEGWEAVSGGKGRRRVGGGGGKGGEKGGRENVRSGGLRDALGDDEADVELPRGMWWAADVADAAAAAAGKRCGGCLMLRLARGERRGDSSRIFSGNIQEGESVEEWEAPDTTAGKSTTSSSPSSSPFTFEAPQKYFLLTPAPPFPIFLSVSLPSPSFSPCPCPPHLSLRVPALPIFLSVSLPSPSSSPCNCPPHLPLRVPALPSFLSVHSNSGKGRDTARATLESTSSFSPPCFPPLETTCFSTSPFTLMLGSKGRGRARAFSEDQERRIRELFESHKSRRDMPSLIAKALIAHDPSLLHSTRRKKPGKEGEPREGGEEREEGEEGEEGGEGEVEEGEGVGEEGAAGEKRGAPQSDPAAAVDADSIKADSIRALAGKAESSKDEENVLLSKRQRALAAAAKVRRGQRSDRRQKGGGAARGGEMLREQEAQEEEWATGSQAAGGDGAMNLEGDRGAIVVPNSTAIAAAPITGSVLIGGASIASAAVGVEERVELKEEAVREGVQAVLAAGEVELKEEAVREGVQAVLAAGNCLSRPAPSSVAFLSFSMPSPFPLLAFPLPWFLLTASVYPSFNVRF
ncbi:unnamed protein product [Closterium sp. Naga37s-1]|nr:unnamed protein product [Closterium sp. Naga37s-1]